MTHYLTILELPKYFFILLVIRCTIFIKLIIQKSDSKVLCAPTLITNDNLIHLYHTLTNVL